MASTRSAKVRHVRPSSRTAPSGLGVEANARSCAVTDWTTIVYCWRSSSASANRYGSRPWPQKSCSVQNSGRTPVVRWPVIGVALGSPLRGGARIPTERNGPGRQPQWRVSIAILRRQAGVGVVEEQQVLALDVEDQRRRVGRLGAQHPAVEQRVQQERGVAGLGGDAGDPADVDVSPLRAVEEVDVEIDPLAVAGEPGREPSLDPGDIERFVALGADRPTHRRTRQGRHERLGHHPGHLHPRRLHRLGR